MTASTAPSKLEKVKSVIRGKTYPLSIVKGYVSRWKMAEAVRELIQNALDSESPFMYEFREDEPGKFTLRLNSEFTTLTPQTLLLGSTSKAGSADSIGSFGEGYKLALLVLTREGYAVEVRNGDLLWTPRFEHSRVFGDEILVVDERLATDRSNKGLTFIVSGLDSAGVEEVRASCLLMQDRVGAVKQTEHGDILLDQPGMLYVGSLFVCKTELRFGYNLKPADIVLERDRQTVSDWDLRTLSLKCWYATKEYDRIAQMIASETPDVEYAKYNSDELVKEACYRIFRKRNPGAIIAQTPEEAKRKIEAGMTKVVYVGGAMYYAVSGSKSYREERPFIEKAIAPPHEVLAHFLSDHRDEMRTKAIVAFKALIEDAKKKWMTRA